MTCICYSVAHFPVVPEAVLNIARLLIVISLLENFYIVHSCHWLGVVGGKDKNMKQATVRAAQQLGLAAEVAFFMVSTMERCCLEMTLLKLMAPSVEVRGLWFATWSPLVSLRLPRLGQFGGALTKGSPYPL